MIRYLKDRLLEPTKVLAKNMSNKSEFNNFPQILYTSHAVYCAYEGNCQDYIRFEIVATHDLIRLYTRALGLPRSSDEAQRMLLYFFYGKFFWFTKKKLKKGEQGPAKTVFREKTMVFYLHKKLINGRSKFAKRMEIYFAKFIAAYRSHASEWEPFLTDGGKGSPPLEYNILLEDGVRCCCADIFLMGTKALRSKSYWGQVVHPANKLESWVAVGRHVLGCKPYKKWDNARFTDYTIRRKLARTFRARNLPLSDGNDEKNFNGKYEFDWEKHAFEPYIPSAVQVAAAQKKVVKAEPAPTTMKKPDQPPMIYDVENDCMVPFS